MSNVGPQVELFATILLVCLAIAPLLCFKQYAMGEVWDLTSVSMIGLGTLYFSLDISFRKVFGAGPDGKRVGSKEILKAAYEMYKARVVNSGKVALLVVSHLVVFCFGALFQAWYMAQRCKTPTVAGG